jgi:hypothetical protein
MPSLSEGYRLNLLSDSDLQRFLFDVRRAPSPHNTQPIRWRISAEKIELLIDPSRILEVSDHSHRDLDLSAGAAFALAQLSLRSLGFEIQNWQTFGSREPVYGSGTLVRTVTASSADLEAWGRHACFRGKFRKIADEKRPEYRSSDVLIIDTPEKIGQIAALYDESLAFFLARKDYAEELWRWLRLERKHPDFNRDGLNYEALRLGPILAFFSRFIMRPPTLATLSKLGILKPLVSEAPQNLSAEGFLLLAGARGKSSFARGADIIRTWVDLERAGRVFCPVTSLIDDPKFHARLAKIAGLAEGTEIYHVCRFGGLPLKDALPLSPRLPAGEIRGA